MAKSKRYIPHMNKKDLVAEIAETHGMSRRNAAELVESVLDGIFRPLVTGQTEKVMLTGPGCFEVVKRKAWMARNPQTGDRLSVPETLTIRYRPGKLLLDVLNGVKELPEGKSLVVKDPPVKKDAAS